MNYTASLPRRIISIILNFLSNLFKCIWIFFPSIIFLILAFLCFWTLGQGKDLIVAFAENRKAKILFFIAIAFWTYTTWYSSRIIAYIVARKQGQPTAFKINPSETKAQSLTENNKFCLPEKWLKLFPRLIGFSCLLIIELAVFQLKVYYAPAISYTTALIAFIVILIAYLLLNNKIDDLFNKHCKISNKLFYFLLILFFAGIIILLVFNTLSLIPFIAVLIVLHLLFIFYIHLRRLQTTDETQAGKGYPAFIQKINCKLLSRIHIPLNEFGYFTWFNIISLIGIAVYFTTIISEPFSWLIGPFPFVLLAFGVLLGIGNIVTAVSIQANVNFHLIIFLLALLIPGKETHYVRTTSVQSKQNIFQQRQDVTEYYLRWMNDSTRIASIKKDSAYNMYFVMANGGASRSGYWTASVLGILNDTTHGDFSKHLFCLSGASGGSVGNATFFSLLNEKQQLNSNLLLDTAARSFLKTDFLTYTLSRMLGPDYLKFILHTNVFKDRAAALEEIFEHGAKKSDYTLKPVFDTGFSSLITRKDIASSLPVICINVTRMQDGNPGVVSNIVIDSLRFNDRVDVLNLLEPGKDVRLSTVTMLGARFPYISPAGRIDKVFQIKKDNNTIKDSTVPNYFVDGGYFDNSGAGVVQELIRAVMKINKDSAGTAFAQRAAKLRFVVLHITNSPLGESELLKVQPIKNDLAAPLITLAGAFDKQTTVNDSRLKNLLLDIDSSKGVYCPINLYMDKTENPSGKPEESYAMNWFISKHTLDRMNERLKHQPHLDSLIQAITKQ